MSKNYEQKYRAEWEKIPELKPWLTRSRRDVNKAFCKICNKEMTPKVPHLKRHVESELHQKSAAGASTSGSLPDFMDKVGSAKKTDQVDKSELLLAGFIAEHDLPMMLSDHLVPLIKNICPDSNIAKKMQSARTKTTATIK